MASVEEELNALLSADIYRSKDDVISDAVRALLTLKPGLRIEIAVDLYRNGKVTLWKAAEIASLSMEEFKEVLASRSIKIEVSGNREESRNRLATIGLL
jgi:predicted HTH domain antitoxin